MLSLRKIHLEKKQNQKQKNNKKPSSLGQSNRLRFQFKVRDSQFRCQYNQHSESKGLKILLLLGSVVDHLPLLVLNTKWSRKATLSLYLGQLPLLCWARNHGSGSHFGFHQLYEFKHINLPVLLCSPTWEKRALDWIEAGGSDHSDDVSCLSLS